MSSQSIRFLTPVFVAGLAVLSLAGCARSPNPAASDATADASTPAADATAQAGDASTADSDRAAELAAKEKDLADREAAVKQQEIEAELARRNAESAQQAAAAATAAARKSTAKATPATIAVAQSQPKAAPPPPPPPPIMVPAGTPLSIEIVSPVTTKTAVVGDAVQGRLASDVVVDGRRAAAAGSAVNGTVTQVVSGSKKIGGTPTLGITFNSLSAGGAPVAISARLLQQAASDTGKDTAKVVGTTAAGAIIGHQVSHKNGAVVGGLLGGAAGLGIAQKTGGEVSLAAGTVVSAPLDGAFQVANNN